MQITLYKNYSDSIVVNKNIEPIKTVNAQFLQTTDIVHPNFIIDTVLTCNYCYVEDLNRYYYVMDAIVLDGRRTQLICEVDVLMTYKPEILQSKQQIVRQENEYNMYLQDPAITVNSTVSRQIKNFSEPIGGFPIVELQSSTSYNFVLNTL